MAKEYSVEVCKILEGKFQAAQLHRPMRVARYDAGTELVYNVTGLERTNSARVKLSIEKFVGGGFAGQVYKVKIQEIEANDGPIAGLDAGKVYAMKILIPPSNFSRLFRNALYWVGFQGAFQLQVNPTAARAGALWQKFIRRAAKIRFGDDSTVVDIYATFIDEKLGSCGELSEWIDGRTWWLEIDEHLDMLKKWIRGRPIDQQQLNSPEYRAKRKFMADFVELLHDVGAYEFARQYEWSTCKSQPNCLKRQGTDDNPSGGLVAVDFRAGLALLPFLPMSPGDFKLIVKGIIRGSLVQFDRGCISKLEAFIQTHSDDFADMQEMLEELKADEKVYRDSLPDVTYNHIRLLYDGKLWSTIFDSAVTGWRVRNLVDNKHEQKFRSSGFQTLLFLLAGAIPFFGTLIRRIWGRIDWRRHYSAMLTNPDYFRRSIQAKMDEKIIAWHRAGRIGPQRALRLQGQFLMFLLHLPLSILPAGLHRFITDSVFRKEKLVYIFVRPFKLYFNADLREQWLRDMIAEGQKKHTLTDKDTNIILSQIKEPFIQKYLTCLVVHLFTLPVSEIVFFSIGFIYWITHWGQPNAFATGYGIAAIIQVSPVSPGALIRGFIVLYLVIRERNFKDYNIAVFLGFFKGIGYLAFPIQMTYRYPALSRFMSAHWSNEAVHIVPVFGERGALLEHWVFRLFYNWPLTIRRRMRKRAGIRATIQPRYWHTGVCVSAGALIFGMVDLIYIKNMGRLPGLMDIWWLAILLPLFCGAGITSGCGGAALWRRIAAAAVCGFLLALVYTAVSAGLGQVYGAPVNKIAVCLVWRGFIFTILSTLGTLLTELWLPEPNVLND